MRRSPGVRMKCNKDCIANVCGECAVEKCEGQIQRLGMRNNNAETAAWTYKIAVDSFKDYFERRMPTNERHREPSPGTGSRRAFRRK